MDGRKMNRVEWLMAQIDLDPIESHGSMEMSLTNAKTATKRRTNGFEASSNRTSYNHTGLESSLASKPPLK
jgi:hypothetical protein